MKKLLFATGAAIILVGSSTANAAEIWASKEKVTKTAVAVYINGDIEAGDDETFRKVILTLAKQKKSAPPIVVLNSDGGKLIAGLNIAIMIRNLKLKTGKYAREI